MANEFPFEISPMFEGERVRKDDMFVEPVETTAAVSALGRSKISIERIVFKNKER